MEMEMKRSAGAIKFYNEMSSHWRRRALVSHNWIIGMSNNNDTTTTNRSAWEWTESSKRWWQQQRWRWLWWTQFRPCDRIKFSHLFIEAKTCSIFQFFLRLSMSITVPILLASGSFHKSKTTITCHLILSILFFSYSFSCAFRSVFYLILFVASNAIQIFQLFV